MNITGFFALLGAVLLAIFLFFKPLRVAPPSDEELAAIELDKFAVYKMTQEGLETLLRGAHAKRFSDRYVVDDINLTDRSKGYTQNMQADHGVYRVPVTTLEGNVSYDREDGVRFVCDRAEYDENRTDIVSVGPFRLSRNKDYVDGTDLHYNSTTGKITAEKVEGIYRMKDHL